MQVEIRDACLSNVWEEQFNDRQTGEVVKFYRALLSVTGEPPAQLSVAREDFETLSASIGVVGVASVVIDARPGSRIRAYLKGIE